MSWDSQGWKDSAVDYRERNPSHSRMAAPSKLIFLSWRFFVLLTCD